MNIILRRTIAISLFSALLFTVPAWSLIDVRNGNFTEGFADAKFALPGGATFVLIRTYNSRVSRTGIFGSGFCSNLETLLERRSERVIESISCGAGRTTTYRSEDEKSYVSVTDNRDRLQLTKAGFTQTLAGEKIRLFDSLGRLTAIFPDGKSELKISYGVNGINELASEKSRWRVSTTPLGLVVKISDSRRSTLSEYEYDDNRLVKASNGQESSRASVATYAYDGSGRMSSFELVGPDRAVLQEKHLRYDPRSGLAVEARLGNGCADRLTYRLSSGAAEYSTEVTHECPGKAPTLTTYRFRRVYLAGNWNTTRMSASHSDPSYDFEETYDPKTHRLLSRVQGGKKTEFDYAPQGGLSAIRSPASVLSIIRDRNLRPVVVARGKSERLSLHYDRQSRVSSISDVFGEKIDFVYGKGSESPRLISKGADEVGVFSLYRDWLDLLEPVREGEQWP